MPFPAGSGSDATARVIAKLMTDELGGQSVIVDNKPGAGTFIGAQDVARAPADGHTLLYTIVITHTQNPHLYAKLPYDPVKDFTPLAQMVKSATNTGGLPMDVFDGIRKAVVEDRSQFFMDLTLPFYGYNRPGAKISQGVRDTFWAQGMQCGLKNAYDCIKQFSETDFTADLKKIDVPTLIVHGSDDQIVPIDASGKAAAKLVKNATLLVYEGAPHGLPTTHKHRLNEDLLAFIKA